MDNIDPRQYIQDAELLYSEASVSNAIALLANQLNKDYASEPPMVLCVMGGGVVFAGQILPQLAFPLSFDYIHATRYHGLKGDKELKWIIKPKDTIKNRNVLLLDDILDEGVTLKIIHDECLRLGAKQIKIAVLVDKELNKRKPIVADYVGVSVPDRYVFGCGMDVYGWWRNLPAIYALNNT